MLEFGDMVFYSIAGLVVIILLWLRFIEPFIGLWGAWVVWLIVHLFSLIGVKNKLFVFINWIWNYFTYDQSLRLIIRPKVKKEISDEG